MSQTHHQAQQQRTYGILVGRVTDGKMDSAATPHYEILINAHHANFRIAVNVESRTGSDVFAFLDPDFKAPTKLNLPHRANAGFGFTPLATGPNGQGLDYLRDNIFPVGQMTDIPPEGSGVNLRNLLDALVKRAIADTQAVVLVCGESFQDAGNDPVFHFSPARGVHDIHMMQGDRPSSDFHPDNRVNGDGALFFRFVHGETAALFVRFKTQETHTNDQTGNP